MIEPSLNNILRGAVLTDDGIYRLRLTRLWDTKLPILAVVMLNPSTADAQTDDNTIRKLMGFAARFGYGGIDVYNLFSYRCTDPKAMMLVRHSTDIVGQPLNDEFLQRMAESHNDHHVLVAWGSQPKIADRATSVCDMFKRFGMPLVCLGVNKDGEPKHPLYLPNNTELRRYVRRAA